MKAKIIKKNRKITKFYKKTKLVDIFFLYYKRYFSGFRLFFAVSLILFLCAAFGYPSFLKTKGSAKVLFAQNDWSGGQSNSSTTLSEGWSKYLSVNNIDTTTSGQLTLSDTVRAWENGGINVVGLGDGYSQKNINGVPDDLGNIIVAWQDNRNGDWDIYAQKFDADGNALWGSGGIRVDTGNSANSQNPQIISDGSGGAIIAWDDDRDFPISNFYGRIISSSGEFFSPHLFTDTPLFSSTSGYNYINCQITNNKAGSQIILNDFFFVACNARADSPVFNKIIIKRLPIDGSWSGVSTSFISLTTSDPVFPQIAPDHLGGIYIVWSEEVSPGDFDILGERFNYDYPYSYLNGGVGIKIDSLAPDGTNQTNPKIFSSEVINYFAQTSLVIVWEDDRNSSYKDIYLTGLDGSFYDFNDLSTLGGVSVRVTNDPFNRGKRNPSLICDNIQLKIFIVYESDSLESSFEGIRLSSYDYPSYSLLLGAVGTRISAPSDIEFNSPVIANNYSGTDFNIFISWKGSDGSVFSQKLDDAGNVYTGWQIGGEKVSNTSFNKNVPLLFPVSFLGNDFFILWEDNILSSDSDIYIQKMTTTSRKTDDGYLISSVFDAESEIDWESLGWTANVPASPAVLSFQTRTSFDGIAWSEWSSEQTIEETSGLESGTVLIESPNGRYIQYKVNFVKGSTPVLEEIVLYGTPQPLPPVFISSPPAYAPDEEGEDVAPEKPIVIPPVIFDPQPDSIKEENIAPSMPESSPQICETINQIQSQPLPYFPYQCGLNYWKGSRILWALEHRENIYNAYSALLGRGPCSYEVHWWLERYCNINNIRKGIMNSEEYRSKY